MAEITENKPTQQPPFTEKGIIRMNDWLKDAPLEVKQLPQPNINRLFLLKEFRGAGATFGFDEKVKPTYEQKGDKSSDIIMEWNTLTQGFLKLRIRLNDLTPILQTQWGKEDLNPNNQMSSQARDFVNEVIEINNYLKENGVNVEPSLIDFNGEKVELPKEKIKSEGRHDSEPFPKVPLDEQELDFDPRTGIWYGSPKAKTS